MHVKDKEKLFDEKNQNQKILWHCPFKFTKKITTESFLD